MLLLVSLLFLVQRQPFSFAYDVDVVHPNINQVAASKSNLDTFMKRQLGFGAGIETEFQGKKVWIWFREGGSLEDDDARWLNHFHDPLKSWDSSGLDMPLFPTGISSLVWAQSSDDPEGYTYNGFSWIAARKSYYRALITGSETDWALTFQAVGRLMHLVSDAAVPAHVRNDPHPSGDPYEAWTAANGKMDDDLNSKLNYKSPYPVDTGIFNRAVHDSTSDSLAPVSISALWDQDVYVPGGSPSDGLVGLAEYTNAYFFSEDTRTHEYPHPNLTDTDFPSTDWRNPEQVDEKDGVIENKIYLHHLTTDRPYRVAAASYWLWDCLPPQTCWGYSWLLDDKVYEDYAGRLIPRAVGYSAALLDYFFRETIEITAGSDGIYALYNPNDPAGDFGGFGTITLKARNSSAYAGEVMSDGTIELIVKYRVATSDPFVSAWVPVSEPLPNIVAPERNGVRSIPNDHFVELVFDLPQIIPKEATDLYIQVIYKGVIGAEQEGVAMGFKDIGEPTPYDIFNNMDWVCINGSWIPAGSQTAVNLADADGNGRVDSNEWDIFPHDLNNLGVRYFPSDAPLYPPPAHFSVVTLGPGRSYRVFVLGDAYFGSGVSSCSNSPTSSYGCIDHGRHGGFLGTVRVYPSLKRQTDWYYKPEECAPYGLSPPCEVSWWPMFLTFRGKDGFWALRNHYQIFPPGSACSWDTLLPTPPQPGQSPCTGQ
jgi:hypothetical protein